MKYIIQDTTLQDIGDAIRAHTGKSEQLSPMQMAEEITGTLGNIGGLIERTTTDIYHSGVTSVAPFAFYKYDTLVSANFPNCTTIGSSAFNGCTSLTTAWFPECSSVGTSAFTSCTKIQNAALGITGTFTSGNVFKPASKALVNVSLPYCTSIGGSAFQNYTNLQTLYVPNVSTVAGYAFTGTKISNLTIGYSSLLSDNSHRLSTISSTLQEIHCPQCTSIASSLFASGSYPALSVADFPACTTIGSSAFENCSSLTYVSFPTCDTIEFAAFRSCTSIASVSFPACTSIGGHAFAGCENLSSLSFANCKFVSYSAFEGCTNLISINFPYCSVIGNSAFHNCNNLTSVSFPACTHIGIGAFANCDSLISVNFPACTTLDKSAFYHCDNLNTVYLPECYSVSMPAFAVCPSLQHATFGFTELTSEHTIVTLSSTLTTLNLPSCSDIGKLTFDGFNKLVSLKLGYSSVVALGVNAFRSTPMTNSTYTGSFGSIYVPASLVDAYKTAGGYWSFVADRITAIV